MFLFTSDWHLTDKAKDAYRWEIFDWLKRQIVNRDIKALFILGDITDAKNHHANELINNVVDSLRELAKLCPVYMLAGNHDYSNPEAPLFKFLNDRKLKFYYKPTKIEVEGKNILMVPNIKSNLIFRQHLIENKMDDCDFVLMHQTFNGSVVNNNVVLKGFEGDLGDVLSRTMFISGDIHVPQKVGKVYYCGAPHPVHFGDTFQPRVLYWNGTELKSISRTTTKKRVLILSTDDEIKKLDIPPGDHVKVVLKLSQSDYFTWEEKKKDIEEIAKKQKWSLSGFEIAALEPSKPLEGTASKDQTETPIDTFKRFCQANDIEPALIPLGERILNDSIQ